MTIRLKLTLLYAGVLALTLLVFGVSLYSFLSINSMNSNKDALNSELNRVGERLESQLFTSGDELGFSFDLRGRNPLFSESVYLQINNLMTDEITQSENAQQVDLTIPLTSSEIINLEKKVQLEKIKQINGYPFLIIYKPITLDGVTIGVLSGAQLMKAHYDFLDAVRNLLLIMSLIVIAGAATTGWLLARKALRPIDLITAAANQIQKGDDLNNRIEYDGPKDEIGRLTLTINGMLGRIESSYNELQNLLRTQRRFVSDASHELRTPLTTIRGNVELLQKVLQRDLSNHESSELAIESVADISAEAERMSRLVGDLLSLARADAGVTMEKKIILLKDVIDTAIKRAVFLPRTAEWKVNQLDELDDVYVEGHEDYLLQMVLIFIENAFKYTVEGSVYFAFQKDNGRIGITIEDTGIGISNEDVPFIFDRFYRADLSRGQTSGTGLGLSIAKWIVDEHGGSVEVRTALGKGTRFTIWLPTVISV
ncbi:MAG: hypothetical protein RLZZ267_143 [Bacillota bacterium]